MPPSNSFIPFARQVSVPRWVLAYVHPVDRGGVARISALVRWFRTVWRTPREFNTYLLPPGPHKALDEPRCSGVTNGIGQENNNSTSVILRCMVWISTNLGIRTSFASPKRLDGRYVTGLIPRRGSTAEMIIRRVHTGRFTIGCSERDAVTDFSQLNPPWVGETTNVLAECCRVCRHSFPHIPVAR